MDIRAALNIPGHSKQDRPILNPNINPAKLKMLYR